MIFTVDKSKGRWVSDCGRYRVQLRQGTRGMFSHGYVATYRGAVIATEGYVSEARRACQNHERIASLAGAEIPASLGSYSARNA